MSSSGGKANSQDERVVLDRALIDKIREGDVIALRTLIHTYAQRMEASAYLVVRRDDLAQDAVQDVFIRLWEQRSQLNIVGNVSHYLFRAVRFRAISLIRHEVAEQRLEEAVWSTRTFVVASEGNQGLLNLEAKEFARVVRNALRMLPPRCREIFLMHRVAEMSYSEIAAALEITLPTVHNQMHRANKHLLEVLQASGML